jgi:hypothetical protein
MTAIDATGAVVKRESCLASMQSAPDSVTPQSDKTIYISVELYGVLL